MSDNVLNIYGCGGMGINIGRLTAGFNSSERGWAKLNPIFVDTSHANANLQEDKNFYYIQPDRDDEKEGSGRVRKDNAAQITNNIKAIVNKFPPTGFNLVVFSAHGGSGSVIGPLLVREMLSRNIPVIAIVQGGDEDALAAKNTRATLATLDTIAREQVHKPLVMTYGHNEDGDTFDELNGVILTKVLYLSRLLSGNIVGLDGRDLDNWLNFSRPEVTGVDPQVALLQIASSDEDALQVDDPIAAVIIRNEKYDKSYRSLRADFEKSGYGTDVVEGVTNQYFMISVKSCITLMDTANKVHAEYEDKKQSRVSNKAVSSGFKSDGNTGLIFE